MAQGHTVVRCGLAVGAEARRPPSRECRLACGGRVVAAAGRVVGECAVILRGALGEGAQRASVEPAPMRRRQAAHHGFPGEFVAECVAGVPLDEHPCIRAGVDGREVVSRDRHEQPGIGGGSEHGRCRGDILGRGIHPPHAREDRIAHRRRQPIAVAGEHLGHEERVAARACVERGRVDACPGEGCHPVDGQRGHRHPGRLRHAGEIPHDAGERMPRPDLVVAVRGDDEHRDVFEPPPEVAQRIEGRLVRPVQILEDQEAGCVPQRVTDATEDTDAVPLGVDRGQRLDERRECSRGGDVVRAAHPHGAPWRDRVREGAHERRFADAGLAPQEDEPAAAGERTVEVGGELAEERVPLDEHAAIILARGARR